MFSNNPPIKEVWMSHKLDGMVGLNDGDTHPCPFTEGAAKAAPPAFPTLIFALKSIGQLSQMEQTDHNIFSMPIFIVPLQEAKQKTDFYDFQPRIQPGMGLC